MISVPKMESLLRDAGEIGEDELALTVHIASFADLLLAGIYHGQLICIVGLTSQSFLADTAYMWVITTRAVAEHKIKFARYVRRWLHSDRIPWHRIVGHCYIDDKSGQRWVKWLGAKFGEPAPDRGLIPFEFVRG